MGPPPGASALPEVAGVHWRRRASERTLTSAGRLWLLTTFAHTVPFLGVAVLLFYLEPLSFPVGLMAIAHAWAIPELYAQRGANVVRPKRPPRGAAVVPEDAEDRALGLLGDLVDTAPRTLHAHTGLVLERGELGVWMVGEAGALLVRPGGRQVHCYCVRVSDTTLPAGDRIAHLLLALRSDERGFATVANRAFAGARWRVRRRLDTRMRPALDAAGDVARGRSLSV